MCKVIAIVEKRGARGEHEGTKHEGGTRGSQAREEHEGSTRGAQAQGDHKNERTTSTRGHEGHEGALVWPPHRVPRQALQRLPSPVP